MTRKNSPPKILTVAQAAAESVAVQIRQAIDAQDLSIEALAVQVGVYSLTLRKALRGRNVTLDTLRRIAQTLNITLYIR